VEEEVAVEGEVGEEAGGEFTDIRERLVRLFYERNQLSGFRESYFPSILNYTFQRTNTDRLLPLGFLLGFNFACDLICKMYIVSLH